MTNPKPYLIKPEQRGHRKPLSQERTEKFTVCLPASVAAWCRKVGSKRIREILSEFAAHDGQRSS